mmetsp:Transcript_94941/g.186275  ORF Transcript_94941/g.186275 Transcript_94941/m.186275 type:complete len:262 (-) Transcript_94941:684-1469(-)
MQKHKASWEAATQATSAGTQWAPDFSSDLRSRERGPSKSARELWKHALTSTHCKSGAVVHRGSEEKRDFNCIVVGQRELSILRLVADLLVRQVLDIAVFDYDGPAHCHVVHQVAERGRDADFLAVSKCPTLSAQSGERRNHVFLELCLESVRRAKPRMFGVGFHALGRSDTEGVVAMHGPIGSILFECIEVPHEDGRVLLCAPVPLEEVDATLGLQTPFLCELLSEILVFEATAADVGAHDIHRAVTARFPQLRPHHASDR